MAAKVVPLAALLIGAGADADPCAVRAELAGDASLIRQVGDELARLGVERGQAAPGCRGVFAQLELDGDGIAVAIRDGARRTEGRVVSDAAIAASWIDSWLHDDLDGNAWLLAAPVRVAQAPGVTPVAPAAVTERDREPARSVFDRIAVTAAYEHAWPDDDATESGVSVGGCIMIGGGCLGGAVRFARETDRVVELTAMARNDISMMATGRLPVHAGKVSIAPEVGIGVARMFTRRIDGCQVTMDPNTPPPNCDPSDPMCMPAPSCVDASGKVYVGDDFRATTWTPRLAAGVRVGVPIADRVWLDGAASFVVSPLAHTDTFTAAMMSPDGTIQPGGVDIPGEPGHGFQLGIGIRVGAP